MYCILREFFFGPDYSVQPCSDVCINRRKRTVKCKKKCKVCKKEKVGVKFFEACSKCATKESHPREYWYYHIECEEFKL